MRPRFVPMTCARLACMMLGFAVPLIGMAETASHQVSIRDYAFHPAELTIKVGDRVVWTNDEKRTSHSVLLLGRDVPESERFFPGETWEMRFSEAGEYAVGCGPHPEMRGRIVVQAEP